MWYGLTARRLWSRGIGAGLLRVAVVRLFWLHFLNAPAGYVVLVNARVLTSIIVIAILYGLAYLYSSDTLQSVSQTANDIEERRGTAATALRLVANLLTLTL